MKELLPIAQFMRRIKSRDMNCIAWASPASQKNLGAATMKGRLCDRVKRVGEISNNNTAAKIMTFRTGWWIVFFLLLRQASISKKSEFQDGQGYPIKERRICPENIHSKARSHGKCFCGNNE